MDGFKHSKSLGQNFLRDKNLLLAIAKDADVQSGDVVCEVGAGEGALTSALLECGARVVSYEVDKRLKSALLARFSTQSVEFIFEDILSQSPDDVKKRLGDSFKLVANLPYYITTPVLFYFIERVGGAKSITIMVQQEVAERFTAKEGTADYGSVTATLALEYDVKITRRVSREMFFPVPNVDSAVVRLDYRESVSPELKQLVRTAFSMRRKTLVNNLAAKYGKDKVLDALTRLGLPASIRGERLSPEMFKQLFSLL